MLALGLALSLLIGVSLGFFGGGGSILTVPLLVYVFGLEPKVAIASSLLIVALASMLGALHHWRANNADLRVAFIFGSAGMLGAHVGGRTGAYVDGSLLLLAFASMMLVTAFAMWHGRSAPAPLPESEHETLHLVGQGFAVGCFTGLVGAGGGFLIVPALALWARLPMPLAIGTSLVIIVMNSLAGFAGYASHVTVDPLLIGSVSAIAIAGTFVGSRLARAIDPNSMRRAFAVFVALMATFVLAREADLWMELARTSLPVTPNQIAFTLLILLLGFAVGRITRKPEPDTSLVRAFSNGAGI